MTAYGQFCPVAKATEIVGEKWTLLILRELLMGTHRFNDFQRSMSRISPTVLTKRLKQLEDKGIVTRKRISGQKGHEYRLTPMGRELEPLVEQLAVWGQRWACGQMSDDELDVELLMWDIQRRIDTQSLPDGETVLAFMFADLDKHKNWWLVIDSPTGGVRCGSHSQVRDVTAPACLRPGVESVSGAVVGDVARSACLDCRCRFAVGGVFRRAGRGRARGRDGRDARHPPRRRRGVPPWSASPRRSAG